MKQRTETNKIKGIKASPGKASTARQLCSRGLPFPLAEHMGGISLNHRSKNQEGCTDPPPSGTEAQVSARYHLGTTGCVGFPSPSLFSGRPPLGRFPLLAPPSRHILPAHSCNLPSISLALLPSARGRQGPGGGQGEAVLNVPTAGCPRGSPCTARWDRKDPLSRGGQVAPLLCPVRKNGFLQKVPPPPDTQSKQVGEGRGLSLPTCDNRCQNSHVRADELLPTTA